MDEALGSISSEAKKIKRRVEYEKDPMSRQCIPAGEDQLRQKTHGLWIGKMAHFPCSTHSLGALKTRGSGAVRFCLLGKAQMESSQ
jgi:hypothetical protein